MSFRNSVVPLASILLALGCATGSEDGDRGDQAAKKRHPEATASHEGHDQGTVDPGHHGGHAGAADSHDHTDAPVPAAGNGGAEAAPRSFGESPAVGTRATCAVSGEVFTVAGDSDRSEYQGRHYVFCCSACKPDFDKDPAKYANGS